MNLTMKKFVLAVSLLVSLDASAALYDRGNGLIYDSSLDITWMQDMSYVRTSGYSATGFMSWSDAKNWAYNLDYEGVTGWRLPSARLIGDSTFTNDGSSDVGYYNTRSELGHLYYTDLHNQGGEGPNGLPVTGLANTSFVDAATNQTKFFLNMFDSSYWLNEPSTSAGWVFDAWDGLQYGFGHPDVPSYAAIAVHNGDVAAVPLPGSVWLFGLGLISLAGAARRRYKMV